jgi:hypothetical protein
MKKNKTFLTILVTIVLGFSNCSDFLETEPKSFWTDENFYSTKEEVNLAINGIYSQLAKDNLYGWNFNVRIEAGTDESYTNDTGATWAESKYEHTASSDPIKDTWLHFYKAIQLANQVEKNITLEIYKNEQEYKSALAKVYFMRGFCYFNLANWFGPVPLRLKPTENQDDNNVAPSPVFEVYTQVEKDFLYAAENLSNINDSNYIQGEPNKMAAHGMLARLYLKMGGYQPYLSPNDADCYFENREQYFEKAKQQCEIVINSGLFQLIPATPGTNPYREHFLSYLQDRYDLKESLFEISFGNLELMGLSVAGRLGNINGVEFSGTNNIPRGFCKINASVPLYNLYSDEDLRKEWNIAGFRNVFTLSTLSLNMSYFFSNPLHQEYGPGKFKRWEPKDLAQLKAQTTIRNAEYTILNNTSGSATDPNFTSINFPILRYADVLLMHAEAIIGGKDGSSAATGEALNSLNQVRLRAGLTPYSGNLNHDDFFNELVDERLRELCFEGLRKQDLIRWNLLEEKLMETNQTIKNFPTFNASNQFHSTYLEPGNNFDKSKHLLLPYPLQETQLNSKLEQRQGW